MLFVKSLVVVQQQQQQNQSQPPLHWRDGCRRILRGVDWLFCKQRDKKHIKPVICRTPRPDHIERLLLNDKGKKDCVAVMTLLLLLGAHAMWAALNEKLGRRVWDEDEEGTAIWLVTLCATK